MRLAVGLEYDGTGYCGWQRQSGVISIQETLEKALGQVANERIATVCAGRTDAGVHAFGQVVHFDTNAVRTSREWVLGANSNLPSDIRALWVKTVADDFSARFAATSRKYRYVIYNNMVAPALLRHRSMWYRYQLDDDLMNQGAKHLLGEHDFSSFRSSGCQALSTIRKLTKLSVTKSGGLINIDVEANAFLYHMVRNIVGTLLKVGAGERSPDWVKEVLAKKDRRAGGITVPACGLYLVKVEYQ